MMIASEIIFTGLVKNMFGLDAGEEISLDQQLDALIIDL
jgi:hypothetical protein